MFVFENFNLSVFIIGSMTEIPELHDKLLNHTAPDLHICQDVPKKKVTENGLSVLKKTFLDRPD